MPDTAALATVDIVIVVGFLVVVTIVGYAMSRAASQGIDDYFLGGKKIPWWVLGISSATSNFDMAGTMIIVAVVFALGYKGFLIEIRGGVGLALAFLMVFLGKWLRRSRVMTSAEWMKIRFGTDRQGRAAHLLSAIANLVLSLGMIVYFCKGAGKFLTYFIPIPDTALGPITLSGELVVTSIMVGVGLFYTLMSGLYGVVFTDVIQMLLLTFTALYVTVTAFGITPEVTLPKGMLDLDLENITTMGDSLLAKDASAWEPIFAMFGLVIVLTVVRTSMEGMGGIGGYTDQRFFAARTEREASLLTMEAIVLSIFRWGMVAGLVVMGLQIVQNDLPGAEMIREDAEQVLPVVLGQLLPAGVRGLVLAGLIAAAMSTFDSTLNAGASYVVKDIYQSYMNPEATGKQLIRVSQIATIGLCIAGVAIAAVVPDINQIWGLITMGLGAGLAVPLFLRWYWPGLTGYGFAVGTGLGIVAGLTFNSALDLPLYVSYPAVIASGLVATVGTSMLTKRTDEAILVKFWTTINPWGMWGAVENAARDQDQVTDEDVRDRQWERINDGIALFFSISFQMSILITAMSFVFHDWSHFGFFASTSVVSALGLYFFWFKNLKSTEKCLEEDAEAEREEARVADEGT